MEVYISKRKMPRTAFSYYCEDYVTRKLQGTTDGIDSLGSLMQYNDEQIESSMADIEMEDEENESSIADIWHYF